MFQFDSFKIFKKRFQYLLVYKKTFGLLKIKSFIQIKKAIA